MSFDGSRKPKRCPNIKSFRSCRSIHKKIDISSNDIKATRSSSQKKPTRISLLISSKSTGKVISKTARGDPLKTPKRVLTRTSRRDLARTSGRNVSSTPGRDLSKTSRRDLSKTSRRDLSKTPRRDLSKTPRRDLSRTLRRGLTKTTRRDLLKTSGRVVLRTSRRELSRTSRRDLLRTSGRNVSGTPKPDLRKTSGRNISRNPGRDVSRTRWRDLSRTIRLHLSWTPKQDLLRIPGPNVSRTPARNLLKTSGRDLLRTPAKTKASYRPAASSIYAGTSKVYTKPSKSTGLTVKQTTKTPSGMGMSKSKDITTKQVISGVVTSQTKGLINGTSKSKEVKPQLISIVMSEEKDLTDGDMSNTKKLLKAGGTESSPSVAATYFTSSDIRESSTASAPANVLRQRQRGNLCWDAMGYRVRCTPSTRKYRPRTSPSTSRAPTNKPTRDTRTRTSPPSTTYYDEDTTTLTTTATTIPSDIEKLLNILDNLTYIYDTDLVKKFNQSLFEEGYPYCPSTFTTKTVSQTYTTVTEIPPPLGGFVTGATVTKCFVCGLATPGIPERAECADAFAGDFFPTAQVDLTSRGLIDSFRKHCRYLQIRNWHVNGTLDKYLWGAWTGGCSVRWVDLSGVYTQRSCRNKFRPSLGKHFASKRMAMLEKALVREKDACIISPQASLVPFSRGVSLYARFHACVCTGNYCNQAQRLTPLSGLQIVLFMIADRITKMYLSSIRNIRRNYRQ